MTGFGKDILYNASTGLERALVDVDSARITAIPAELIRDVWDPQRCPVRLLPYLAWALGVQYWNDDWSETTKRTWVASQWVFKSLRGTEAAIRMAVDFAGRDVSKWGYRVLSVTARPQQVMSGPSLTRTEREAWLQQLPQVRVWRVREQGIAAAHKSFYSSGTTGTRLHSERFCFGGGAPVPSDAISRTVARARWVESGVETDVTVDNYGSYFQLHRSGAEDGAVYCGRPFGCKRHYIPSTAWQRLITIKPYTPLAWRSAATPTLQAVTSEPERVVVSGTRKYSVFCDTPLYNQFFVPTTAPLRIYQRYAVLDPSVRELRRSPVQFMSTGRYGFPGFTAWVEVSVGNQLSPKAAGYGYYWHRYFIPHNGKPLTEVRKAIQAAKSLRDKILLRSGPTTTFLAGDRPILADVDTMYAEGMGEPSSPRLAIFSLALASLTGGHPVLGAPSLFAGPIGIVTGRPVLGRPALTELPI